jgi:hypothetical protein
MKFAMAEQLHEKYVVEVSAEISQDSLWKKKIFWGRYEEKFLITGKELESLPCNLWMNFSQYDLEYYVSKVHSCPQEFAEGLVIFKFEAKEFPQVVSYSANSQHDL